MSKPADRFWQQPTGHLTETGEPATLASEVAAMRRDRVPSALIDRWVGGFLAGVEARERRSARGERKPPPKSHRARPVLFD